MSESEHWMVKHVVAAEEIYDIDRLLGLEWLLTNGTGGYAMGSVAGCNTRRYHGLLVAAADPPGDRVVVLNQVLETLTLHACSPETGGEVSQSLELGTCLFQNEYGQRRFAPQGYCYLKEFEKGLGARWVYSWGSLTFERRLQLHWKRQAATLHYRISGLDSLCRSVTLRLQPLVTLRGFHSLLHCVADDFDVIVPSCGSDDISRVQVSRGGYTTSLYCGPGESKPPSCSVRFERHDDWWYSHHYPVERYRGLDDLEDQFTPGSFVMDLSGGDVLGAVMTVSLGGEYADPVYDNRQRELHLSPKVRYFSDSLAGGKLECGDSGDMAALVNDELVTVLVSASDEFIVDVELKGRALSTVIAGYPWFSDWGRDTFIALPGLLLGTGRFDESRDVLRVFAESIEDGLVPNRFDESGAAHYNTIDASLWFIHAAMAYVEACGDTGSWESWLSEACMAIVESYRRGTRFGIMMEDDGLITGGGPETQLTWMDAACGEPGTSSWTVFTPRYGKAVEINALWYSALAGLSEKLADDRSGEYGELADHVRRSFESVFWSDDLGYLIDHVYVDSSGERYEDRSIRPNQIFACSLSRSPLPVERRRRVVEVVGGRLLTPYGLRTLPADDPAYHGRYGGDQFHRDRAYHQGTVWAWLIGPYAESLLRLNGFSQSARCEAYGVIRPLLDFMTGDGLGQINEIYEGDAYQDNEHRPVGCIAQAWSIAEVMRVIGLVAKR